MKPGFARDQIGDPWLIVERNGSLWAIGYTEADASLSVVMRLIGGADDDCITFDLSKPNGFRWLKQVAE